MPVFSPTEDAYGRSILAHYRGERSFEIVEREDGFFNLSEGPATYFEPYERWPEHQHAALAYAHGRTIDIGCGAGRVALHLQAQGFNVLGVDASPLAIEVCRLRGLRQARALAIEDLGPQHGAFETLILFGNNFGLLGGLERGRALLRRLAEITPPQARILAESNDYSVNHEPAHLAYAESDRRRGRLPGQFTIRVRFQQYVSPWFDYLIVTPDEMAHLLAGTGWRIERTFTSGDESMFAAVIVKEEAQAAL